MTKLLTGLNVVFAFAPGSPESTAASRPTG